MLLASEILDHGQAEGEGLARSRQITSDQIVALVHRIEAVLLDREKVQVALCCKSLDRSLVNLRVAGELAIFWRDDWHRRVGHLLELANIDIVLVLFPLCRSWGHNLLSVLILLVRLRVVDL